MALCAGVVHMFWLDAMRPVLALDKWGFVTLVAWGPWV